MSNQVARTERNQMKLQKLRDRVRQSTSSFLSRQQSRLSWWQSAFRTPTLVGRFFSGFNSLWVAFLSLLGVAPKSHSGRGGLPGKVHMRGLLVEGLESRQLMAVAITGNNLVDSVINFNEQSNVFVSGTVTSGSTVTVLVDDGVGGGSPVQLNATVTGTNWTAGPLNVSTLLDGTNNISISAIEFVSGVPASLSTPSIVSKDTVGPPVSLPFQITSDDIINIAERSAVVVAGLGATPDQPVQLTFSVGATTIATRTVQANSSGGFLNNGSTSTDGPVDLSAVAHGATVTVSATSFDQALNIGSDSRNAITDFIAPSPPVILTPTAGAVFNATTGATVTVSGSGALPNGAVVIQAFGGSTQTAPISTTALADGTFSLPLNLASLANGPVTIVVSSVDNAGNPGSSQVVVSLDTIAPTLVITSPANAAVINAVLAAGLVVSGTASTSENGRTVNIAITDSVTIINTSAVVTAGSYATPAVNIGALNDGPIVITAVLTDAAGNSSGSIVRNVVKDASAPNLAISVPVANDGFINLAESSIAVLSITGVDTALGATNVNYSIVSSGGGSPVNNSLSPTMSSLSAPLSLAGLPDGTLTFTVTQTDSAGNLSTRTLTAVLDTLPPLSPTSVAATVNPNGPSVTLTPGDTTRDNTINFTGNAPQAGTVRIFAGSTQVASVSTAATSPWGWSATTSAISPDGTYAFTAVLVDAAGNPSTATSWGSATIDTTAPGLTVVNRPAATVFTAATSGSVNFDGTTTLTPSAVSLVFFGGSSTVTATATLGVGTWAATGVNLSSLPDGPITLLATATDAAGNSQSVTVPYTKDTVASTPAIATPIGGLDNVVNRAEAMSLSINGAGAEPGQPVSLVITNLVTMATYPTLSVNANASGGFVFSGIDLLTAFGAVEHNFSVKATTTDAVGNTASDTKFFAVDTIAPGPISLPTNNWGTNGINASEQTNITVAGAGAAPGRNVTVTFDDDPLTPNSNFTAPVVRTVTAGSGISGPFALVSPTSSANLAGLLDGNIVITVSSSDAAGNETTFTQNVIKDSTLPVITIDNTVMGNNNINASEVANVFVSGTVSWTGPAPSSPVVNVSFSDGVNPAVTTTGTVTAGIYSSAPVSLASLNDGNITVTVTGTDLAGNVAVPATKVITKDTSAPTLTITSPVPGALINATTAAALNVQGTVSEANTTVLVQISDGVNPPVVRSVVATGTTFTLSPSNLADVSGLNDGGLTITVIATDSSANSGNQSLNVVLDKTAPTLTISSISPTPASGIYNASQILAIQVTGSSDANGRNVTLTFTNGATTVTAPAALVGGGTYTTSPVSLAALGDGTIQVQASVTDAAGNTTTASTTIQKDVNPPTVTIADVTSDNVVNGTEFATLVISGTSSEPNRSLQLTVGGANNSSTPVVSSPTANGSGTFNWSWTLTATERTAVGADGAITVTANTTDVAGNAGSATRSINKDTVAPAFSGTLSANWTGRISSTEANSVTFSGASGAIVDPAVAFGSMTGRTVTVNLRDSTTPTALTKAFTGTINANGSFTTTADTIPAAWANGTLTLVSIVASDAAGNTMTTTGATTSPTAFELDRVNPLSPVITDANTGSLLNNALTRYNTPLLAGTIANNAASNFWNDNSNATIEIFLDGGSTPIGTTTAAGGNWSFQVTTPINDGARSFTARATDSAGNTGNASAAFVLNIDATAPVITVNTIAGDDRINLSEATAGVVVSGTAEAGMSLTVTFGTLTKNAVIANASGVFSTSFSLAEIQTLPQLTNVPVQAVGNDAAGNPGSSAIRQVQVDRGVPAPTITTPAAASFINASQLTTVNVTGSNAEPLGLVVVTFTDQNSATVQRTDFASAAPGNYTLASNLANLTTLADGPIDINVTSFDSFGNAGSASRTVTLDRVAPVLGIGAIASDDWVNSTESSSFTFILTGYEGSGTVALTLANTSAPLLTNTLTVTPTLVSGNWIVTVPGTALTSTNALVDGQVSLSVAYSDLAGNSGSNSRNFNLDRVAPPINITVTPAIAGDGRVNGSEAAAGVVVSGTGAHPNSTVTVIFSDTSGVTTNVQATATADGSGNWTASAAILTSQVDGIITITASSSDTALNVGQDTETVELKKSIPQITMPGPYMTDNVISLAEATAVIVSGAGAEVGATVIVTFADSDPLTLDVQRSVTAGAGGLWTLAGNVANLLSLTDTTNLVITATTTDVFGNSSSVTNSPVVILDKTGPAITIGVISGNDFVNLAESPNSASIVISGAGARPSSPVTINVPGLTSQTVTSSPTGTYTANFNFSTLTGSVIVSVSNADEYGNTTTINRTVFVDRVAPANPGLVVTSNAGANAGVLSSGSSTSDNTLVISGASVESILASRSLIASVEILNGTTKLGDATFNQTAGSYTFNTASLPDAAYAFNVRITDAAGNSATFGPTNITVDIVAPTIALQSNIAADGFISIAEVASGVTVTGTSNAPNGAVVTVTIYDSLTPVPTVITKFATVSSGAFSFNMSTAELTSLMSGTVTIVAQTSDAAGNTGTDTKTVVLDKTAPTITMTTPTEGSIVSSGNQAAVVITGTTEPNRTLTLSFVGTSGTVAPVSVVASGSGAYSTSVNLTALGEGAVTISASVTDAAGNPSAPFTRGVIKDTQVVPVTINTIMTDNIVSGSEQTVVQVTGNAEPNRPVTVVFLIGSNSVTAIGAANPAGAYTLNTLADISSLPDGLITVTVTTSDVNGNTGFNTATFTKDTTGPVVTTALFNASLTGSTTIMPASLSAVDAVSPPASVTFTVTTGAVHGFVALASAPSVPISTFTQAQVNAGQIVYTSLGTTTTPTDAFSFQVSDAVGNTSSGTLNIARVVVNLPNVNAVTINGGQAQRSKVKTMTIEFDQVVNGLTTAGAVVVQKRNDNTGAVEGNVGVVNVALSTLGSGPTLRTVATLTFGANSTYVDAVGSLVDGNYQVRINAGLVTSLAGGFNLDGDNNGIAGDDYVFGDEAADNFFRLFGDLSGATATGVSVVDGLDATNFLLSFGVPSNYNPAFDSNEDGFVDGLDATNFLLNFGKQRNRNGFV
jgi:hypothetical protein